MPDRTADARYPIHPLLARRWSPRSFSSRTVEPEKLLSLLEAARWAPSTANEQPWSFLIATREDSKEFERMASCLMPGNAEWARAAPVLAISVAKLHFSRDGRPNRHAFHDTALAVANLTVQAMAFDLYVHQMAGIHPERIVETYLVPEGHEPVAGIAIGYLGEPEDLPAPLRERERAPRSRISLREFVFSGAWGRTAPLVAQPRTPDVPGGAGGGKA